jgi:hypothetical protein
MASIKDQLVGMARDAASEIITGKINEALGLRQNSPSAERNGFNPQNIVASINKSGVAKTAHFEVQIVPPATLTSFDARELMCRTDSAELPGRSLMTMEHRFSNYGPINKIPYGQMYSESAMTFILSEDMREKQYFEEWQNSMIQTGAFEAGSTQQDFYGYSQSQYNPRYFDDYTGSVIIRQYGSDGSLQSIYTLQEAYPIIMSPVSMSWSDDSIARMSVSFAFRNYKSVFYRQDQPGLGSAFSFKIGKGGIAGSVRIPGFGTISSAPGAGAQFNLNPLKKKVFSYIGL